VFVFVCALLLIYILCAVVLIVYLCMYVCMYVCAALSLNASDASSFSLYFVLAIFVGWILCLAVYLCKGTS